MTRFRLVYHIQRKEPDRVDAEFVKFRVGLYFDHALTSVESFEADLIICSIPERAAPSSGVLGLRMTCTGIHETSSDIRPFLVNDFMKEPFLSNGNILRGIPPPI